MVKWFNIRSNCGLDNPISQTHSQKYAVFLRWLTFIHSSPNQTHWTITLKTHDEKITLLYMLGMFKVEMSLASLQLWKSKKSVIYMSRPMDFLAMLTESLCKSSHRNDNRNCPVEVLVWLNLWFKTNILRNIFTFILNLALKRYFWHYNKEQIESSSEKQFLKTQ